MSSAITAIDTMEANLAACYPGRAVAGFGPADSTWLFYSYLNALVGPASVVLDLGAGRGELSQCDQPSFVRSLAVLKGRVRRIFGVDVDPIVKTNPSLDEAFVIGPSGALPFPDATFDVIFSDWVLEHVDEPGSFACEIERVLKPGGWFCARTPNKFGLVALGASLIPNRLHTKVLKVLQPERQARDVFPTRYRLNTLAAIRRHFDRDTWRDCSFRYAGEIVYLARSRLLLQLSTLLSRITPPVCYPHLLVFLQKRA
jgi:SAM-dependent methyltransferase